MAAVTPQVIILIGFDYQGGGVDFASIARNRQKRLLAAIPQITVTLMDVGAGTKVVSAMTLGPSGIPVRTVTTATTHSRVTSANYSTGLGHHAKFDQDQGGRMSITDLYAAIQTIGADRATASSLIEVSVFSHGRMGGPILVNSDDHRTGSMDRDADDKDARIWKDFVPPNMSAAQLTAFQAAFAPTGVWWSWGCAFTYSYRQVTHRFINSPLYKRNPVGTLKDSDRMTFSFPQEMAQAIYEDDLTFFPQTKWASGRKVGKFKDLRFERTVKEIKEFFLRGVDDTYHRAVRRAAGISVRGALLGTYADYESNDRSIKLPLMEIPRNVRIFGTDFTRYLTMWTKVLGFTLDTEGHGYGVF
jgi:hypothetical protein